MNCVELFAVSNSKKYILIIRDFLWNISLTLSILLNSYFSYEFVGVMFCQLKTFFGQKFCQTISKRPLLTDENIQTILKFTISKPPKTYFKKNKKNKKNKIKKKFVKNLSVASISYSWNVLYCVISFQQLFLSNN